MDALMQFAGRLHVMLLHAPIGLLIGLASLELFMLMRRRAIPREIRAALGWLVAFAAAASVGTGLLLSEEGGFNADTLNLHQWLGIASGVGALLAAIAQQAGKMRVYAAVLALTCGLIVPTGHLGASMTHGDSFLTEPFAAKKPSNAVRTGSGGLGRGSETNGPVTVYVSRIAPILSTSCISCHNEGKRKGRLSLDTPESIMAGGASGEVVVAGDVETSELVRRLRLPLDDDDHMPPPSKGQLSEEEIKTIEAWIKAGASFSALADVTSKAVNTAAGGKTSTEDVKLAPAARAGTLGAPAQAPASAIASIRTMFVHVEPVSRESPLLVIDASAVARDIDDAAAKAMLEPVLEQTADLTLARTKITDATLALISKMPRLRRLNIASTGITDAGVAMLGSHAALEEMIVSNCKVTDVAMEWMEKMPMLKRVYVWKTAMTVPAIASLRTKRSGLVVDAGDTAAAVALEKDEPVKPGTVQAPASAEVKPVDAAQAAVLAAAAKADALKPVNSICPVSGKPVVEGFAIVYKGRVIGFCCRHCLGQFLEEPTKFEASVK